MNKQGKLLSRGYIFGLGAFRRYKEITGADIAHFEECLKPEFEVDEKNQIVFVDGEPKRIRFIDDIEANYRWVVMLKAANDVYCTVNNIEKISIDEFIILHDKADQKESIALINQYFDSSYLGKPMRDYYGLPKPQEPAKKKPTARAKRTPKP